MRKRKDGRWEARYTVGFDPATGKQIQKSVYGSTQQAVREKLRRVQSEIENGVFIEPSKLTVAQWLNIWHTEYCGHLSESTKALYEGYIETISSVLGALKLQMLTPPIVQSFYNGLKVTRGKNKGEKMNAKSVNNIHGAFHKALKQAMTVEYIRTNPTDACVLPKIPKTEIKPLLDEQIAEFLRLVKGHRYEIALIVTLFIGVRQGELVGLTWDCIDFNKGTIYLYRQLQRKKGKGNIYHFVPLKHGKTRTITCADAVMQFLQRQKKLQIEMQLKAGPMWSNPDNLVFTNELGEHISPKSLYNNYKKIVRSMGCENARFHDLRHSYAAVSLGNGDDIKTLQVNLGHHTAAFTLSTYGHISEKRNQDSADRMDNYIQGITGSA